jgi:hypothetical protein
MKKLLAAALVLAALAGAATITTVPQPAHADCTTGRC